MYFLHTGDLVRLREPAPTLWLPRGEMGVVQYSYPGPATAYEVEFHPRGRTGTVRGLVFAHQVEALRPRQSACTEHDNRSQYAA